MPTRPPHADPDHAARRAPAPPAAPRPARPVPAPPPLTPAQRGGRGNHPVGQAALQSLQQTQGNRAAQRLHQRTTVVQPAPPTAAPAAPGTVAPAPLSTMDDLIALVQRIETAYPGDNWQGITTRIRKAYYSGFLWNSMIKDREDYGGLSTPPLNPADYQAISTASAHPTIAVNGATIDIGHVFTGLDATNFPHAGVVMGAAGVEGPPGATWGGDVGSALAEWDLKGGRDRSQRATYYLRFASDDDMLGDVDGIALSQPGTAAPGAAPGPLSARLRAYYLGPAGGTPGAQQRFTKFAQGAGFHWTGRGAGIQLDAAARAHIRTQIDNFGVAWRRQHGGQTGANWFHDEDLDWFRDRFVTWVQQGLAAENP